MKKFNLEKLLFYLFVFFIPFQTRKVLFFSLPAGRFNEWTSGFLYFTDLLIILILFLGFLRGGSASWRIKKKDILLGLFFLIAALSLLTSQNIKISIYQLVKLAEFLLLFLYIKYNLDFLGVDKILKILVASGTCQALLAIVQFLGQSSLGLKHIEAGVYNANIPGVATFFVNGIKFMRAYGTAPHPNVLGIFLLTSIFCLYWLFLTNKKKLLDLLLVACYLLCSLGLLLTFSRAIILIFIASSLFFFVVMFFRLEKPLKFRIISLFLLFAVCYMLYAVLFWPEISARFLSTSPEEQAVTLRVYYNDIALSVIKERPFFGLGAGNFVWYLLNNYRFNEFWLYQPVHNVYLLIASEIGIFGLIVFLVFMGKILFKELKKFIFNNTSIIGSCFTICSLSFAFLCLIDHYFWTIQQSSLIFWTILALVSGFNLISPRSSTDRTRVSGA